MATSVGAVFLEVVPSLDKFASLLNAGTLSDVKRIGQNAGKEFGQALTAGSKDHIAALQSQLSSAALATERASMQVATAHNTTATAAGKVEIAEARLAEARARHAADSSVVVAAEKNLERAKRDSELQSGKTALAETTLKDAQDKQALSATALKTKQEEGTVTSAGMAKGLGVLAVGAAAAAVAVGGVAVKAAADFQTQLVRLATSAGESTSNLKMVGDGILKMAGDTGTSTSQLTAGMYQIESAGFHGADGLRVLQAAAEGAKAEGAQLSVVGNAVTDLLVDYHLKATDAADVTSKMVTAVGQGKTTFEALSGAMSSVAPVASAAGVSMSELLGDMASMTSHGVTADQAAQNLANAIRSLSNPSLAASKELAQFGLDASDLSKNLGQKGVAGTLEEVSQAIMQHMGPEGTTLFNAFNQSKQAAGDADKMFAALPPNLQKLATEMRNGTITQHEWTQGLKQVDPIQGNLLKQWLTGQKRASGFNDMLKSGGAAAQTYTQALAKATGNSTTMNVALMLTGENAAAAQTNIKAVAEATAEAGGHVKGWAEIQETFNQKAAVAKESFHALVIAIGQRLLPVATQAMGWVSEFSHGLMSTGTWLKDNANWIGLVATVIGGLLGPLLVVKGALGAWKLATDAVKFAQLALNIVLNMNPIMLLVMAIAGLVAGLIYAYTHFRSFHNLVNQVGSFLRDVFMATIHGLVAAFEWTVHAGEAVGRFFSAVFTPVIHGVSAAIGWVVDHWRIFAVILAVIFAPITIAVGLFVLIVTHARQIGQAFSWLWSVVLRPVFEFVGAAVVILAKIILAILIAPVVIAVRAFGALFSWLYSVAIKPAFDAIGAAAMWLWNNVFQPAFYGIGYAVGWVYANILLPIWNGLKYDWQLLQDALKWLHENVFKPIWEAIGAAVEWVYQNVLLRIWNGLKVEWRLLQDALKFLHENVFMPIWHAIGQAVEWVYQNVLLRIWNGLKWEWQLLQDAFRFLYENVFRPIWSALGDSISWVYHNVIEPVWGAFKAALGSLEDAFRFVVAHIGDIWDGLKKAFGTPIEFVIRTILNDGLIKGINSILSVVGTSIPTIPDPNLPTFAVGGVVPGYAPGQDTVHALLSPGEGVLVPQAVRALGGEGAIAAINARFGGGGPSASGGLPGFAGGGFISDILGGIGSAASGAWNAVKSVALGGLRIAAQGFFDGVVGPLVGSIPGGPDNVAKRMLTGLATNMERDILDFLGHKDATSVGGSIPVGDHLAIINAALSADGIPQDQWPMWQAGMNTLIQRESGWNAGAVNNWDCLTIDAVILTQRGWLKHDEVRPGDLTIGYNPATGRSEWTTITGIVHYNDAPLVRMGNSRWHATTTPNHRWLNLPRKSVLKEDLGDKCHLCTWPDGVLRRGKTTRGGLRLHLSKIHGIRPGKKLSAFATEAEFVTTEHIRVNDRITLAAPADTLGHLDITVQEAAILGWIAGDGHVETRKYGPSMTIAQSKPAMVAKLQALLGGIPHADYVDDRGGCGPRHQFRLDYRYAQSLLERAGHAKLDAVAMVTAMSTEQRAAWLEAIIDAEGTQNMRTGFSKPRVVIYQADGPVQEAIKLAVYLSGSRPSVGKLTGKDQWAPCAQIGVNNPFVTGHSLERTSVGRGDVWCVTTELGTWTAEEDGHIFLTGNSNAKAGTPSGGLAQVIGPTFAAYRNRSLVDNLLDPVANVAASINYILGRYGSISKVAQANPNLPPQGYDEGGYLQPGMSRVLNATGRPEPVFTSRQWDVLKARLKSDKGGDTNHYHITTTDPIAVATEIERRTSLNLTAKL